MRSRGAVAVMSAGRSAVVLIEVDEVVVRQEWVESLENDCKRYRNALEHLAWSAENLTLTDRTLPYIAQFARGALDEKRSPLEGAT